MTNEITKHWDGANLTEETKKVVDDINELLKTIRDSHIAVGADENGDISSTFIYGDGGATFIEGPAKKSLINLKYFKMGLEFATGNLTEIISE